MPSKYSACISIPRSHYILHTAPLRKVLIALYHYNQNQHLTAEITIFTNPNSKRGGLTSSFTAKLTIYFIDPRGPAPPPSLLSPHHCLCVSSPSGGVDVLLMKTPFRYRYVVYLFRFYSNRDRYKNIDKCKTVI